MKDKKLRIFRSYVILQSRKGYSLLIILPLLGLKVLAKRYLALPLLAH